MRWTTTHTLTQRNRLTFTATADDGVRVFVDGVAVIDVWKDQSVHTYTASIDLDPGDHVLRMDFYENGGQAVAKLSYTSAVLPDRPRVALVTSDTATPPTGDVALHDHLVAAGDVVDYVSDATFDSTAAAPYAVVWIAGNARPSALGSRLTGLAKPILVSRSSAYTTMKLATSPTTVKSDNITIVDSTHPLAAGRTGTQTLATKVVTFGIGTPTIFAYTAGQPLVDASAAPACRAGLPFDFNSPASLSANGWAFVDAAMSWALGSACVP